jgi:tetratricopeptide (TPR) repeat protein
LALNTGDWETAKSAVSEVEAAGTLMGDNPFALAISLFVHHVALQVAEEHGESREELGQKGADVAMRLQKFTNYRIGSAVRAWYLEYIGDHDGAARAWQSAVEGNIPNWYMASYLSFLYRNGEYERALALAERESSKEHTQLIWALLLAETPEGREEVRQFHEQWIVQESELGFAEFTRLHLPLFLGDTKAAKLKAKECLQRMDFEAHFGEHAPGVRRMVEVIAGEATEEQLLKEAGSSRGALHWAHYLIGLMRFSAGDRDEAKKHLESSVQTGLFFSPAYQMTQGILERMEREPNWPDWIRPKRESE